jgi:hypothetical protein
MVTLPSGLPEYIGNDEKLARFLPQSNLFTKSGVKPAAFLPNPKNGETSVFRHGGENLPNLWSVGFKHIPSNRTLHGAAIIKAHHVREALLEIVSKEPPDRHANIIDWPCDADPEMEKAKRKDLANQIAQHAELFHR